MYKIFILALITQVASVAQAQTSAPANGSSPKVEDSTTEKAVEAAEKAAEAAERAADEAGEAAEEAVEEAVEAVAEAAEAAVEAAEAAEAADAAAEAAEAVAESSEGGEHDWGDDDDDDDGDHDDGDDDDDDDDGVLDDDFCRPRCGGKERYMTPFCSGDICFEPGVRLRLRYGAVEDDPTVAYVGRNDGFGLTSARVKLRGTYSSWVSFALSLEGGFVEQTDKNLVSGSTFAALKDAWVDVHPFDFFQARFGQFKLPFDEESIRSTASLRFTDRSVAARGIRTGEGYQQLGLTPPRDLGVMVGTQDFRVGPIGLLYLFSITNGNGVNQAYNDNSAPAFHGRLALSLWDFLSVGGGALYNPRTTGELPNLFDENDVGFTADLHAAVLGAFLDAGYHYVMTQYPTTGAPDSVAMGAAVEAGYVLWFGLGAGYRFGWFEPTSTFDNDSVMEHTVGVRYDFPELPLTMVLDYTIALEEPGRELQNNRVAGVLQLDF